MGWRRARARQGSRAGAGAAYHGAGFIWASSAGSAVRRWAWAKCSSSRPFLVTSCGPGGGGGGGQCLRRGGKEGEEPCLVGTGCD